MMKNTGIITLNGYFNYGNRLQNYALQEALKQHHCNVETIWIEDKKSGNKRNLLKKVKPKAILNKVYRKFYKTPLDQKRENKFKEFSNAYIKETEYSISEEDIPLSIIDEYNYFVTGSDQVWNPHYTKASSLYFLTFASKEKRIAYAPSFGISNLPEWCKTNYKQWLNEMNYLSVREDAGANLIKELTGKDAEVLPDPTLLLSKENWLSIAKPASNKPKEDYLLTYFLGPIPAKTQRLIKSISKKYTLKNVNLAQLKHKKYYLTDPSEFLDFINSATVFFTDSFHGSVFSILFETPFVVTDRESKVPSMNSRINTLLSTYSLEDRHISNLQQNDIFNVDFSHVEKILEQERDKANTFLNKALNS